jgi:hypothetical protein
MTLPQKTMNQSLKYFVSACPALLPYCVEAALDLHTERLIEQLPQVSNLGYGYSSMFSGSQFLPDLDAPGVQTLVLGSKAKRMFHRSISLRNGRKENGVNSSVDWSGSDLGFKPLRPGEVYFVFNSCTEPRQLMAHWISNLSQ